MNRTQQTHPTHRDLTKGDILPHMWRLSLPMAWGIAALISFSLVDTYFIARLGADRLAAIGYALPVTMFVFNITFSFSIAMSSVIARKIGENLGDHVQQIVSVGVVLAAISAALLSLLSYICLDIVLSFMGASHEVVPYIYDYMYIWFLGAPVMAVTISGNAAIRAGGDTLWPAIIMTIVAVVNLVLDPLLIFGLAGFPRLEMQGAAIATVLSYCVAMLVGLSILKFREKVLVFSPLLKKASWALAAKSLLIIAVPVLIASAVVPVLGGLLTAKFADYGDAAVAGFGLGVRIETFLLIPIMALGAGIGPLVGQNWGAKNVDRVRQVQGYATKFCLYFGLVAALLTFVFAIPIANLFTDDVEAQKFAILFLEIVPMGYAAFFYLNAMSSILNAVGKARQSLTVNLIKSFALIMPCVCVGEILMGPTGMMAGIAVAHIIAAIGVWGYMLRLPDQCMS